MGRIQGREAMKAYIKKWGGSGVDFFTLKDDGDSATVRLLHTDDTTLELALVHRAEIDSKEKWVECLEESCPLCGVLGKPTLKLFIFLYDYVDDKVKMWERGATMVDTLIGLYDKYGNLNNRDYEIKRNGKAKSAKTTYMILPEDKGPMKDKNGKILEFWSEDKSKQLESPEKPDLYGRFVLQMTKEEMAEIAEESTPQDREKQREKVKDRGKGGRNPGF